MAHPAVSHANAGKIRPERLDRSQALLTFSTTRRLFVSLVAVYLHHCTAGLLFGHSFFSFVLSTLLYINTQFSTMHTFGAKPNPKIVVPKREVRVEKAAPVKKPSPLPFKQPSKPTHQSGEPARSLQSQARARPATPDQLHLKPQKRKAIRQKSPAHQHFESSSEDEADSPAPTYAFSEKRQKSGTPADLKRQLRAERVFSVQDGENLIHGASVANENPTAISLELQYPAAKHRER
jgi:hypothetical protein